MRKHRCSLAHCTLFHLCVVSHFSLASKWATVLTNQVMMMLSATLLFLPFPLTLPFSLVHKCIACSLALSRLFPFLIRGMKMCAKYTKCHWIIVSSNSAPRASFFLSIPLSICSPSPMFPRRPLVSLLCGAAHALHALVELAPPSRGLKAQQSAASPHLARPSVRPSSRSTVSLSCRVRPRIAVGQRSVRRRAREAALRGEGSERGGEWPAWATKQGSGIMRWKCVNTQTHKHTQQ